MKIDAKLELKYDRSALDRLLEVDEDAANRIAERVTELAIMNAPVRDGTLRRSIRWESFQEHTGVFTECGYGAYVELGTGLFGPQHRRITPRTKRVLAWKDRKGKWHYARSVRGMRARPYLAPALHTAIREASALLEGLI